jgi:retron-type reverse transcriptase
MHGHLDVKFSKVNNERSYTTTPHVCIHGVYTYKDNLPFSNNNNNNDNDNNNNNKCVACARWFLFGVF